MIKIKKKENSTTNVVDLKSRQKEKIPTPVFNEPVAKTEPEKEPSHPVVADRQMEQLKVYSKAKPVSDLLAIADKIQSHCRDIDDVKANTFFMNDDLQLCRELTKKDQEKYALSSYAFGQLLNKSGMDNVKFAKKCIDRGYKDLVSDCVNRFLGDCNRTLKVRLYEDPKTGAERARGILTDRYSALDTPDILRTLNGTLGNDYKVTSYMLNEERFHARLLQNKMLGIEDLFAGLQVDSSDIGRSILTVRFFIYKQVCTNGLIVSQGDSVLFEQKHIGINQEDFKSGLEKSIDLVEPLVAQYKESIKDATSKKLSRKQMDELLEQVVAKLDISEKAVAKVIDLAEQRYGKTQWGVINGLTELAQDYTLERRIEIEQFAGSLLQVV